MTGAPMDAATLRAAIDRLLATGAVPRGAAELALEELDAGPERGSVEQVAFLLDLPAERVRAAAGAGGGAAPSGEGTPTDDRSDPLIGQKLDGYVIEGVLGEGGMGRVYRARQQALRREVALKVLPAARVGDAEAAHRFVREARAAAAVNDPHVVACYGAGRVGERLYVALELVAGGDLEAHALREGGRLPEERALRLGRDVAHGLAALDAAGLVHRDVKPANIFLTADGRAKLGDLGLARSRLGEDRVTGTGLVVGTPAYIAPEQALGEADARADVYALGATLYRILTGQPPYEGTDVSVLRRKLDEPPPDPRVVRPELSAGTARLIGRAMASRPEERPASARALAEEIDDAIAALRRDARIAAAERAFLTLEGPTRERVREALLWLVDAGGRAVPRRAVDLDADVREAALRSGLVVERDGALGLAEDALLGWERLRAWVEADRAGQLLRHALGTAADTWEAAGCRAADLWRGERLAQARHWRATASPWLPPGEGRFLETSERAERRRRYVGGATLIGVGLGLAVAAGVATLAWQRAERALEREQVARREAVARGLAAEVARRESGDQLHAALVFEAARASLAGEESPASGWLAARLGSLTEEPAPFLADRAPPPEAGVGFRPVGGTLTRVVPATGEVRWTADTGLEAVMWADPDLAPALVLVSDFAGRLVTLDGATGALLARYDGLGSTALSNAVDPTGQFVASSVYAGTIDLWEARAGVRVARLAVDEIGPVGVEFAPDGLTVLARSATRLARWSPPGLGRVDRHGCPSAHAAPSPDQTRLILHGRDGRCVVDLVGGAAAEPLPIAELGWTLDGELRSPAELAETPGEPMRLYAGGLTGLRELPDPVGGWLLLDERGPVWRSPSGDRVRLPPSPPVATAGPWLVVAVGDQVDVVALRTGAVHARLAIDARELLLREVAVWGDRVVAGRVDGTVLVWDIPPSPTSGVMAPSATLTGAPSVVSLVVASGDHLLVGHGDGTFEVFDAARRRVATGRAWEDIVTSLALDPGGERLLVGVGHARFAVWHLPTGRPVTAVTRERRGALHSVGWTAGGEVWGAGMDGAWTWAVPAEPPEPLGRTNLRVCEASLTLVPVADAPATTPWAPAEADCG